MWQREKYNCGLEARVCRARLTVPGADVARFPETRWSLVRRAGSPDWEVSRAALDDLLKIYTWPVDCYLLAAGIARQQVADVRQEFFLDLLTHGALGRFDPAKAGRFRYFLKGALQKHLGHLRERDSALKRGSGRADLSLEDLSEGDGRRRFPEPTSTSNPDREFMVGWMVTLVQRALDRLSEESREGGQGPGLDTYRRFLTSDEEPDHGQIAGLLGTTPEASRARLKRLRRRFRTLVRQFVAETVDDRRDVDDELRCLLS